MVFSSRLLTTRLPLPSQSLTLGASVLSPPKHSSPPGSNQTLSRTYNPNLAGAKRTAAQAAKRPSQSSRRDDHDAVPMEVSAWRHGPRRCSAAAAEASWQAPAHTTMCVNLLIRHVNVPKQSEETASLQRDALAVTHCESEASGYSWAVVTFCSTSQCRAKHRKMTPSGIAVQKKEEDLRPRHSAGACRFGHRWARLQQGGHECGA